MQARLWTSNGMSTSNSTVGWLYQWVWRHSARNTCKPQRSSSLRSCHRHPTGSSTSTASRKRARILSDYRSHIVYVAARARPYIGYDSRQWLHHIELSSPARKRLCRYQFVRFTEPPFTTEDLFQTSLTAPILREVPLLEYHADDMVRRCHGWSKRWSLYI